MKAFLKWALIVLAVLVLAVVVIGLLLPSKYHVERSVVIDAPPAVVFGYINDLEEWEHWEPFSKSDPSVVTTLGEDTTGEGATQSWTSDGGDGSLVFTMSDPDRGIAYDLTFEGFDPSTSEMLIEEVEGGKTELTWTMDGEVGTPVVGGYLVMMMDAMVGPMYDDGLANLKRVAEAEATDAQSADDEQ